ncbi:MAG: Tat pathway signal sequence domain protein [Caulobacterales bacterium]|nr:Tat pathway signal sequence domain protein [Caulobacterales bacterium]
MSGSGISRRDFLGHTALVGGAALGVDAAAGAASAQESGPAANPGPVVWLDGQPPTLDEGQCWGHPWARGQRYSAQGYQLVGAGAEVVPVQSWPLAWWPDGSIKWTGHALAAGAMPGLGAILRPGKPAPHPQPVAVRELPDSLEVTCAGVVWRIGRAGETVIQSARIGGREVMRAVGLVATAQDQPDKEAENVRRERFVGAVASASVEQRGPLRAVIRLEGRHQGPGEAWLPFTLRLYFHAGSPQVRMVHSLVFDGDPARRFVSGLGLTGEAPMADAPHDRHVRFGGQGGGLWAEAVRPLTGLRRDPGPAFRTAQVAGEATPPLEQMPPTLRDELQYIPAWGDFTLSQPNPDGFTITKRTGPVHGWISADGGARAPGFGYVGGASGGVGFGLGDFWQRAPVRLDIRDAASDTARFTLWSYSPDAAPMDLRFYHGDLGETDYYHQNLGLDVTYEDFEPGWGSAQGIARTTEFRIWALPRTPTRERLAEMAALTARPPRLLASPQHIHAAGMFGAWGFVDRSSPTLGQLEDRARRELDFYLGQVEQRRWYGFWNYGDVQHSYDNDRHVWRYDIGGFAWDNSELSSDLWLWYAYLRSGRADVFRMAEAMTRHTGEVDVYHAGRFRGLGTRHGVQHWGDSSKQPRISNAAYRRIYYYMTTDERVGDLMHALVDSDRALLTVEIERKVGSVSLPPTPPVKPPPGQVMMSFGTVWGSLVAAWFTEWERTGDTRWRDRIVAGMESIAALPKQWFAGYAFYDLASGRFTGPGDKVTISHLNGAFGVFEMHVELLELLDVPKYREAWLDYCQYYNAPPAEFTAKTGAPAAPRGLRQGHSRFTAYAAVKRNDPALARRAWAEFSGQGDRPDRLADARPHRIEGPAVLNPVDEIVGVSTNDAAQWGLAATQLSALVARFA